MKINKIELRHSALQNKLFSLVQMRPTAVTGANDLQAKSLGIKTPTVVYFAINSIKDLLVVHVTMKTKGEKGCNKNIKRLKEQL